MLRKAKVFMTNRSHLARPLKEFRLDAADVLISKVGDDLVRSPRPVNWSEYFGKGPLASADFMENAEDLPVQERGGGAFATTSDKA